MTNPIRALAHSSLLLHLLFLTLFERFLSCCTPFHTTLSTGQVCCSHFSLLSCLIHTEAPFGRTQGEVSAGVPSHNLFRHASLCHIFNPQIRSSSITTKMHSSWTTIHRMLGFPVCDTGPERCVSKGHHKKNNCQQLAHAKMVRTQGLCC